MCTSGAVNKDCVFYALCALISSETEVALPSLILAKFLIPQPCVSVPVQKFMDLIDGERSDPNPSREWTTCTFYTERQNGTQCFVNIE